MVRGSERQREFAKRLGFSTSYLSEVESGKTRPSLELLVAISQKTNKSIHWLLTGEGPAAVRGEEVREEQTPYGDDPYTTVLTLEGEQGRYAFRRSWLAAKGDTSSLCLLEVKGDSMEPTIADGDMVLVDRSRRGVIGGAIYVLRSGEGIVVRRLQPIGRRLQAISDNKLYETYEIDPSDSDIEVVGQVIWIGRELVR